MLKKRVVEQVVLYCTVVVRGLAAFWLAFTRLLPPLRSRLAALPRLLTTLSVSPLPNWVSPSLSPACRGQTKAVRPSFRPTLQQQPLIRRTLARPQGQVRPPMEDLPRQKYVIVHAIVSII